MVGLKNEQRACVMNKRSIVVNIGSGGMMEDERYLFGRSGEASGSRIGPVGFGKKFKYLREGEKKGVFLPPHGFRCLASLQFFTLYLEFRADFFSSNDDDIVACLTRGTVQRIECEKKGSDAKKL